MAESIDTSGLVEKFKKNNGALASFTTKEVILIFHTDTNKRIDELIHLNKKLEKSLDLTKETLYKHIETSHEILKDHDLIFNKIMVALPEKGFCSKVTNCLYPEKDIPLSKKVENMYYLYKISKYILGFALGLITLESIRLIYLIFG